jgi:predicted lipid-binding transport protein (Tim44 family)
MNDGIPYADIVILALIAGFILLRLRSVLGSKMGNDHPDYFNRPANVLPEKLEPVVQIDEKSLKPKPQEETDAYMATLSNPAVSEVLNSIKDKDTQFSATHFLEGARGAFEMIFEAFAKGDGETLKFLLSDPIFQEFSKHMAARGTQENKTETTLVSVQAKDITHASIDGTVAHITVKILSEQVTVVRNPKGEIVDGNPSDIHHVDDNWTFERDVTAKNPNWKVIET